MVDIRLFRSASFGMGNLAGLMSSCGRGGLQFMLIIWLQGIWLPLHGYSFESTPLWAGIYLLPATFGFLIAAPLAGSLADRYGARLFTVGGMLLMAVTFVALVMIPVNFDYWIFAILVFLNGLGGGIFTAPNTAAIMSSVPAAERGCGFGSAVDLLQRRHVAVDRNLLLAHDHRAGQHAAHRDEHGPAGSRCFGLGGARGGESAAGRQPVRGVPRLQPDRRTAGAVRRAAAARCECRRADRADVLPDT